MNWREDDGAVPPTRLRRCAWSGCPGYPGGIPMHEDGDQGWEWHQSCRVKATAAEVDETRTRPAEVDFGPGSHGLTFTVADPRDLEYLASVFAALGQWQEARMRADGDARDAALRRYMRGGDMDWDHPDLIQEGTMLGFRAGWDAARGQPHA